MKTLLTFISAILVISFIFIAMPETSSAQAGCCRTVDEEQAMPAGECIPCQGASCYSSQALCVSRGGFFNSGICQDTINGATCIMGETDIGCCVVRQGDCFDDAEFEECFTEPNVHALFPGKQCSGVRLCDSASADPDEFPRNVPTLSEWGLIALAGALGLIGLFMAIRRRTASAGE